MELQATARRAAHRPQLADGPANRLEQLISARARQAECGCAAVVEVGEPPLPPFAVQAAALGRDWQRNKARYARFRCYSKG